MPSLRRRSTASTISTAVRPNLERSPVDSIHLPAPLVVSRARTPMWGRMPSSCEVLMISSTSRKRSTTMIGRAAETLREQRRLDVGAVLVAVADDQGARRVEHGEGDQQLGLAAGLEADVLRGAVLDDLLDDVALLVDLDRVDAAKAAVVAVLVDRLGEGRAQALHAARQDVGEAHQQRRAQAAVLEIEDQVEQVDARPLGAARTDLDVAAAVHREETGSPGGDIIQLQTVANSPASHHRRAFSFSKKRPGLTTSITAACAAPQLMRQRVPEGR